MKLQGKVALVTGAGSGLGREIALAFAREGCAVGVNDIRAEPAAAVAREVAALGVAAAALPGDVADGRAVYKMFAAHIGTLRTLDILVNNAGTAFTEEHVKRNSEKMLEQLMTTGRSSMSLEATATMTDGHWRRSLAIHLDGTFYCTREALKIMEAQRRGCIINMASIAGLTGIAGAPDYSAAKAGILGFTKSVAREVIGAGIRVNAIAPGYVDTPLLDVLTPVMRQMIVAQTPAGRLGTPAEVAATAVFLASDDASYFVGQTLSPNGGLVI
ncbi:MAG: SDR family oxidoreductase [Myxococcales bacterium]|jgi:3-oxoacyl-[acyl-carrier protein] reductase|nr:SDR family oxidoreductase [Myxococcales bacterium]